VGTRRLEIENHTGATNFVQCSNRITAVRQTCLCGRGPTSYLVVLDAAVNNRWYTRTILRRADTGDNKSAWPTTGNDTYLTRRQSIIRTFRVSGTKTNAEKTVTPKTFTKTDNGIVLCSGEVFTYVFTC